MAMTTETVWAALDALLDYAKNCGLLHPLDETFARNTLLSELRLESYEKQEQRFDFPECLNLLCDYAAQQGMIADTIAERDLFDTKLMGFLTPRPSEVVREFRSRYTQSPKAATDYFYTLVRTATTSAATASRRTSAGRRRPNTGSWKFPSTCPNRKKTHGTSRRRS